MSTLRQREARLAAWRSFYGIAHATRLYALGQSARWAEHLATAGRYLDACAALRGRAGAQAEVGAATVALAVGTDLGLCGRLNREVAAALERRRDADPPAFEVLVGRRLAQRLDRDEETALPTPATFAAAEGLAARIEAMIDARVGGPWRLVVVVTHRLSVEGVPIVALLERAPDPGAPAEPVRTLGAVGAFLAGADAMVRHARILHALCLSAAREAEARLFRMTRAEDASARSIAQQRQALGRLRQELVTQEMLEVTARQRR
ncbi:MAG: F0F1 ATP synthase subunit gamma [Myxococcales bacterium]|nr:F0F1 ATP synthase subunit gamma [Myxococcales bacterium]